MYNNEPFDDYIRSILGYPNINNTYTPENNNYNSYYNYSANNTVDTNNNNEIEECYPEIYKIIYPMIQNRCKRITEPLTKDLIENITNEIYSSIEVTNEINIDNVNIASQNEVNNSNNTVFILFIISCDSYCIFCFEIIYEIFVNIKTINKFTKMYIIFLAIGIFPKLFSDHNISTT